MRPFAVPGLLLLTAGMLWLLDYTLAASLITGVTGDISLVLALVWFTNRPAPQRRSLPRTNPSTPDDHRIGS